MGRVHLRSTVLKNPPGTCISEISPSQKTMVFTWRAQYRAQGIGQEPTQVMLRPGFVRFFPNNIVVSMLYAYVRDYPFQGGPLADPRRTGPQPEHRLAQEFRWTHTLAKYAGKRATAQHRFRLEQRWLGQSSEGQGVYDWHFAERAGIVSTRSFHCLSTPRTRGQTTSQPITKFWFALDRMAVHMRSIRIEHTEPWGGSFHLDSILKSDICTSIFRDQMDSLANTTTPFSCP